MLFRLFETGLKSPGNEGLFMTSLRTSSDGQTPHRGAAIGLVFERLIEEGRKILSPPPAKPKRSSTFDSVTLTATNTVTTMTKSPPNTTSSRGGGGGGSEMTKVSSVEGSGRFKRSSRKRPKLTERPHSPPCGCGICKRDAHTPKKSSSPLPS